MDMRVPFQEGAYQLFCRKGLFTVNMTYFYIRDLRRLSIVTRADRETEPPRCTEYSRVMARGYSLDSSTIDLCMALFPPTKSAARTASKIQKWWFLQKNRPV